MMKHTEYATEPFALHPVIEVPRGLVLEVAVGLDTLEDICARYGYDEDQTDALRKDAGFRLQVNKATAELKKEGITFRMRAAHAAEDLIGEVWRAAIKPDTGLSTKIEALKVLSKLGGVEPQPSAQAQSGPGFSITINIPGQGAPAAASFTPVTPDNVIEMAEATPALSRNSDLDLPEGYE